MQRKILSLELSFHLLFYFILYFKKTQLRKRRKSLASSLSHSSLCYQKKSTPKKPLTVLTPLKLLTLSLLSGTKHTLSLSVSLSLSKPSKNFTLITVSQIGKTPLSSPILGLGFPFPFPCKTLTPPPPPPPPKPPPHDPAGKNGQLLQIPRRRRPRGRQILLLRPRPHQTLFRRCRKTEKSSDHGPRRRSEGEHRGEVPGGPGARARRVRRDVPLHRPRLEGAAGLQEHLEAEAADLRRRRGRPPRGGDHAPPAAERQHRVAPRGVRGRQRCPPRHGALRGRGALRQDRRQGKVHGARRRGRREDGRGGRAAVP